MTLDKDDEKFIRQWVREEIRAGIQEAVELWHKNTCDSFMALFDRPHTRDYEKEGRLNKELREAETTARIVDSMIKSPLMKLYCGACKTSFVATDMERIKTGELCKCSEVKEADTTAWRPIATAPKGKHVSVIMKDGTIHENAHWASDRSGEEQPPFEGWYIPSGNSGYVGIEDPVSWKPR